MTDAQNSGRIVIARKQFAHLTDLLEEFMANPSHESDKALMEYQEAIRWPWRATQEQVDCWNDYFAREARKAVA